MKKYIKILLSRSTYIIQAYLVTFLLLFGSIGANCQSQFNIIDIDTINVYPDKIYVSYKTSNKSLPIEEGQAYLYPHTLNARASKFLPRFIKTTVKADSVVLHGTVKAVSEEGKYRIGKYLNGQKEQMNYYNSAGDEITSYQYYQGLRSHRDQEQGTGIYFIHGARSNKSSKKGL